MLKIKGLKTKTASSSADGASAGQQLRGGAGEQSKFMGVAHERKPGDKVHMCSRCDFPIAVYGQLLPCKHAFCLQCAIEMGQTCYLCFSKVEKVLRVEASKQALYTCGVCLRTHESLDELLSNVRQNGGGCCQAQAKAQAQQSIVAFES